MFRLKVLNALLSFSGSLANKCVFLNSEPFMIKPTLTDLNPAEFNYYPFVIRLDQCNGSCNAVNNLSTKNMFS